METYRINRSVLDHLSDEERAFIARAERCVRDAHHGQLRAEGSPFVTHLIAVAENAAGWKTDCKTIAAALLHDVVEDTLHTIEDVRENFGEAVAFLVDGATKVEGSSKEETSRLTREKVLTYFAKDRRVAYVKLADRVHNLSTIAALRDEQIIRIYKESETFYLDLAHKLGDENVIKALQEQLEGQRSTVSHITLTRKF